MVVTKRNVRRGWGVVAVTLLVLLALLLAACGSDDGYGDKGGNSAPAATPTPELLLTSPALDSGPDLNVPAPGGSSGGDGRTLPGCADPNSDECPSPLQPTLDATATFSTPGAGVANAGATSIEIMYFSRYWEALTGAEAEAAAPGSLIVIQPSQANKFPLKGTFSVSLVESGAAVLDALEGAEVTDWTAAGLGAGTVAAVNDAEADPPLATVYGVFDLSDGRAVLLRLDATGKYSLDFHNDLYTAMLDSLKVTLK